MVSLDIMITGVYHGTPWGKRLTLWTFQDIMRDGFGRARLCNIGNGRPGDPQSAPGGEEFGNTWLFNR